MTSLFDVPVTEEDLVEFIVFVGSCMASQRESIEKGNWQQLNEVIPKLQEALLVISRFPGGMDGLRDRLENLPEIHRESINQLMETAAVDRRVAAELIKINLHRLSALKVLHENSLTDETYGSDNSGISRPGSRVSTRA